MKVSKQNKINDAVAQGIKLGIEIFDNDMIQDFDLNNDLSKNNNKQFSNIITKTISSIVLKFLDDIKDDDIEYFIIKSLCLDQEFYNQYVGLYVISDTEILEKWDEFLDKLIDAFGPNINLNWINVSNVTNMESMFTNTDFNGDISKWDVSNVQDMSSMFWGSRFNSDISLWDVSNVKYMSNMFTYSNFTGDLSKWDVSNVENMAAMFKNTEFNGNISNWDVSNVRNMNSMFQLSQFNGDISQWDVSNVVDMDYMFYISNFNQDISNWNLKSLKTANNMFCTTLFNQDLSNWRLPKKIISKMFGNVLFPSEYKPRILKY